MLIPIGHEESEVRRLPWVSIVIGVSCILVYWLSGRSEDRAFEHAGERLTEVVQYYYEHPYLEPNEHLAATGDFFVGAFEYGGGGSSGDVEPGQLRAEQEELDRLTDEWQAAMEDIPLFRFGLIPNDFQLGDLFASMFMHAGLLHLIGNLFYFWLSGPPLEDVWGRPVFAAFYLAAGLFGGLLWVARYPDSSVPLIGASGAVAGLMGAFMVRFWASKIKMFYFFIIRFRPYVGTFSAPSWVMLGLWFATELFWAAARDSAAGKFGGVANLVHVAGFAFGAVTALLIRHFKTEEKVFQPKIGAKLGEEVNTALERAHELQEQGRLEDAWAVLEAETRRNSGNYDANLALWNLAVHLGRPESAKQAMLRCVRLDLRRGEHDLAAVHWLELAEQIPGVEIDLKLRIQLAEALVAERRDEDAADLLASVHETLSPLQPLSLRTRLAKIAARARSASAPACCESVLGDPALGAEARQEVTELYARAQGQGLRPPPGEAPPPLPDEALPLSAEQPVIHRVLKVIPALPKALTGEKISFDVAGQGGRLLPVAKIQAVAAAKIDDGQRAFVVVDLLVDSLFSQRPEIRAVRLRSDAFDARALVPEQADPHQALVAFIDSLVQTSGASALPDAESIRGKPFYSFASLAEYESMVFGFTAG